jgi:hypothetical protein
MAEKQLKEGAIKEENTSRFKLPNHVGQETQTYRDKGF